MSSTWVRVGLVTVGIVLCPSTSPADPETPSETPEIIYPSEQIAEAAQPAPQVCPANLERMGHQQKQVKDLAITVVESIRNGSGSDIAERFREDLRMVTLSSLNAPIPDMLSAPMQTLTVGSADGAKVVGMMQDLLINLEKLNPESKPPEKKWWQRSWREYRNRDKGQEVVIEDIDPSKRYTSVKESIEAILKSLTDARGSIEKDLTALRPQLTQFQDLVAEYNSKIATIENNIRILEQTAAEQGISDNDRLVFEADVLLPLNQALLDHQQMRDICLHGVHALSQNIRLGEDNARTLERVTGITYPAAMVNLMGAVAAAGQERGHEVARQVTSFTQSLIGHSNQMLERQGEREAKYAANGVLNVGKLQETIEDSLALAEKLENERRNRLQQVRGLVDKGREFEDVRTRLLERSRNRNDSRALGSSGSTSRLRGLPGSGKGNS